MNDIIQYTTSPLILTLCVTKYFFVINTLINHMKKRGSSYNINKILYVYNTIQILLNLYIIYGMRDFISYKNVFGINSKFTKNIEYYTYIHYLSKYLDYFDSQSLLIQHTLQALTVLGLSDLILWCQQKNLVLMFGIMDGPDYLSLQAVPDPIRDIALDRLQDMDLGHFDSTVNVGEVHFTPKDLMSAIKESQYDPAKFQQLREFIAWYDPASQYKRILPEWADHLETVRPVSE